MYFFMVDIVKNNLDKIQEACKLMQVEALYIFGSGARENDFNSKSDIDFLYRMIINEEGLPVGGFDYFDLMFKLEEIIGRKIDLVPEKRIRNKYFLSSILEDRIKIYEA